MPLPANRSQSGSCVPLEELWRDRASHIALELGPLERQWRLLETKCIRGAITYIGLGNLLEDLGKYFVGEVVDVH